MMKTNNISVAIDVDGVIADFEGEFCNRFGCENRHLANLHERYPNVDRELIDEFVNNPEIYWDLGPIFGGILLANDVRRLGFNIVIMTNRPKSTQNITKKYLEHYNVPYTDIIFTKYKGEAIEDYNRIYTNQPIKVLFDDLVHNLDKLPAGVTGIAWEQPWNTGYYPRARYNPETMTVEGKFDKTNNWTSMWYTKKVTSESE